MSLNHCIKQVSEYDPDKYLALMTCDSQLKKIMFPIYALNVEISRIPYITSDRIIAEMRLQWWLDLLSSFEGSGPVVDHPIAHALKEHLVNNKIGVRLLKETVRARIWDINSSHHQNELDLWNYIEYTSSNLLKSCLGSDVSITSYGRGVGMAFYLLAVPKLLELGRNPLPDFSDDALYNLAKKATAEIDCARNNTLDRRTVAGFRLGWMAPIVLRKIMKKPQLVLSGELQSSEFRKKIRLLRLTFLNSY